ncbi:hypothetical protein BDY21DRAFT_76018 [Lineolata rhizophorae]|uniref:Uncharacterized protein n=1 Tax=Lineolata rhizophorae TaxID=578093 RepID=A0A6A6NVZ2_9PEZI|nr:hypothetical protein BDY21DRAFT_76018 [Lineolata rhizophorae]
MRQKCSSCAATIHSESTALLRLAMRPLTAPLTAWLLLLALASNGTGEYLCHKDDCDSPKTCGTCIVHTGEMMRFFWAEQMYNYTGATLFLEVDNSTNSTTTKTLSQHPQSEFSAWIRSQPFGHPVSVNGSSELWTWAESQTHKFQVVTDTVYTTSFPNLKGSGSFTEIFTWPTQYLIVEDWYIRRFYQPTNALTSDVNGSAIIPTPTTSPLCDAVETYAQDGSNPNFITLESYSVYTLDPAREWLTTWTEWLDCQGADGLWTPCIEWTYTNYNYLPRSAYPDLPGVDGCMAYIDAIPTAKVPVDMLTTTVISYNNAPASRTTSPQHAPSTSASTRASDAPSESEPSRTREGALPLDEAPDAGNGRPSAGNPTPATITPAPANPFVVTVGSSSFSSNGAGQLVAGTQTLSAGGPPATIDGTQVWQVASGTAVVVGGSSQDIVTPPGQPGAFAVGPSSYTANSGGQFVFGSQTLSPGGQPVSIDGTPVYLVPEGSAVVIGGSLQTQPEIPLSELPSQNEGIFFTVGSTTYAANARGEFVVGSQTLSVGGPPITIQGQPASIVPEGTAIVIAQGSTQNLNSPATADSFAHVLTIGPSVYTADYLDRFVVDGQTLLPGGPPVTVDGVMYSELPDGSGVVVGGSTVVGDHGRTSVVDGSTQGLAMTSISHADVVDMVMSVIEIMHPISQSESSSTSPGPSQMDYAWPSLPITTSSKSKGARNALASRWLFGLFSMLSCVLHSRNYF